MPAKTRRPARRKKQTNNSSWTFVIVAAIFIIAAPGFMLIKINSDTNKLGNQIEAQKKKLANQKDVLNNIKADKERLTDKEYIFAQVKERRLGLVLPTPGQVRSISHFPDKLKQRDLEIYGSDNSVASRSRESSNRQ